MERTNKMKTKKQEPKKNIFEALEHKKIPYAVGVALTEFKIKGIGCDRDYYLMAYSGDKSKLRGLRFGKCQSKNHSIIERNLSDKEVDLFKHLQDRFTKVSHDANGRVYELKNNSFKEYYTQKNNENRIL